MAVPLLIGGATTSRIHTALRVDPAYSRNAGRARRRRVAGGGRDLEAAVRRRESSATSSSTALDVEYRRVIDAHERAEVERNRMTIEDARANGAVLDLRHARP